MNYNPEKHHRRSIRLKDYDYSQSGAYFVTICSWSRECLFGEIIDGNMQLEEFGQIIQENWIWLSHQYKYVHLDEWSVMPNHLHGIIVINDDGRGGSRTAPTNIIKRKSLGRLIGAFKTVSTKQINLIRNTPGEPVWQRNYYERIIRNEDELNHIREYIINNPSQWAEDENNPENLTCLCADMSAELPAQAGTHRQKGLGNGF
jgi:REP element-mobilizing transposase RayT